ncbi:MAG: hypothetical protein EBU08_09965, partial [Micrococcales bacterium]|nr:hypothetical protein [Micrococcales bacterium]
MNKVVAVSLWGNDLRYVKGAVKNAHLSAKYYPDWEFRIYAEIHLHEYLKDIPAKILAPIQGWANGRFWRFAPAFEADVDVMISRDCDSRIGEREAKTVSDWLGSDKKLHSIKDHVRHYDFPFLAGMWGVRGGLPKDLITSINFFSKDKQAYLVDQLWLSSDVWKNFSNDTLISGINETSWMKEKNAYPN